MSPAWTKYYKPIMSLSHYFLLSLFGFNNSLHFNIPWMDDVFLFSYLFLHYGQTPKNAAIELVYFIWGHVCITAVKTSNVFYLHLLWCTSLFQIVKKCAKNYHFLKNHKLVKKGGHHRISFWHLLMNLKNK